MNLYVVSEGYGQWEPIAIYESLDEATALDPAGEWRTDDRGVTRNWNGAGRDLLIQCVPLVRSAPDRLGAQHG
jgi:hypothetical protein